jgi:hypothetical protein
VGGAVAHTVRECTSNGEYRRKFRRKQIRKASAEEAQQVVRGQG